MKGRFWCVLTACLAMAAPAARAQEGRARPGGAGALEAQARSDEAFKMVEAYLVSNLQESLSLTDEQFVKALPLVKKLQGERREYYLARARLLREMRRLMRSGTASEAQVVEKLRQLKTLDAEGPARTRVNMEALDAALTPIQQAKYRLLEGEVEQRMRELMRRVRAQGAGRGAREPR